MLNFHHCQPSGSPFPITYKNAVTDENRDWLTLSEASKLLGIHPATLRQWVDAGQVPSFRTPGGHRRFLAADLRAFLMRASTGAPELEQAGAGNAMLETALVQTRSELRRSPPDENTWYSAFDDPGRERQRALGRQLFEYALQYVTRTNLRSGLLPRGRALGQAYAESSLHYNISLLETVRAFQYFRMNLLQALTGNSVSPRPLDVDDLRLRQDVDIFLNEVLYGLIEAYEGTVLGAGTTDYDNEEDW